MLSVPADSMTPPLRILLSSAVRKELAPAIAELLGQRAFELVTADEAAGLAEPEIDIAFISRDVTGLSTKHVLTPGLEAFYAALRRSGRLQWVHMHSAGADRPIYAELRGRGVAVTSSSGANAEVVAQTAIAGLLALARRFPQLMAAQQARIWAPLIGAEPPRDLAGQTALLVGWGPIGQRIGAFLRLLGIKLIVVRQSAAPIAGEAIEVLGFASLPEALPRADWLLLACPLTAQTRRLIDASALACLPRGACLINVARGEVVVEADLIEALRSGHLGGAFLDVFEHEPLQPDSPLWSLANVMVTPHSAGHSNGNHRRVCDIFLSNLARLRARQSLLNSIP
jgi:phosphoglycerate dehydrogenase-like enzyme